MAKPTQKVVASVQGIIEVVCQNCGDRIEIKIEGWSNFGKEEENLNPIVETPPKNSQEV